MTPSQKPQDGGAAFPDARDDLAIRIMMQRLEADGALLRYPNWLASASYRLVDAMLAAREAQP